jgi:hypothetical protein
LSADGRAAFIDRAQPGRGVQRDAGTVTTLVHAPLAIMLDDEFLGHPVAVPENHHQVATPGAAGAGGKD